MVVTPRAHQTEYLNLALSSQYLGLVAFHGMGLGKTYTTLLMARHLLAEARAKGLLSPKFIIFCPKSAVITWKSECQKLTPDLIRDMIVYPYSQMKNAVKHLGKSVFPYVLLGLDECHYLKTHDTLRIKDFSEMLAALAKNRYGFTGKVMPMTGTPIPNNAAEIYTMWALCTSKNLHEASARMVDSQNFEMWRALFTNRKDVNFKRKSAFSPTGFINCSATSYEGVAEADKLHQLIAPIVHYKRVQDCIDLPEATRTFLNLDLQDDNLLKDADIAKPDAYMSLIERISKAKAPYMIEWVEEFLKLDEQLVVFSMFTTPLRILAQKFPKHVKLITGRESQAERSATIQAFQNGTVKVVAMSYKAGSESLNFQQARNTFYLNFPWNDDTLEQAIARTNRSGQKSVTNHYFMMSGENDRRCYDRVLIKRFANEEVKSRLLNNPMVGKFVSNMFEDFASGNFEFDDLDGLI